MAKDKRGFASLVCLCLLVPLCFMAAALSNSTHTERRLTTYFNDSYRIQLLLDSGLETALQKLYDHPEYYAIDYKNAPRYGTETYYRKLYDYHAPDARCRVDMYFYDHARQRFRLTAHAFCGTAERKAFLYLEKKEQGYAIISRNDCDE